MTSRSVASPPRPRAELPAAYREVRRATEALCERLETEDYVLQSMPDASPIKWHLAHTTWFFETFVLSPYSMGYRIFHPQFSSLFNSYYNAVGSRWPRARRGLLSRPTTAEIYRYRAYVDEHMEQLLRTSAVDRKEIAATATLGLHHEQQHQELIVTDLKHAWSANPLHPVFRDWIPQAGDSAPDGWQSFPEGLAWIGHDGDGFAFDNESPRHRAFLHGFQLATRLTTSGEYLAFMADCGYQRPELWLSDGWAAREMAGWDAPLYWERTPPPGCRVERFNLGKGETWFQKTLAGPRPLDLSEPVCHVSYYEADAYARWAGARLATEAEWEFAAGPSLAGGFMESGRFHPSAVPVAEDRGPLYQMFGDVWQWTSSPYIGYPGYSPPDGALGEYNGKFMCNQFVLRGASCATPRSHARPTYRNFFPPDARWQFSGVRLAKDFP